MPLVTLPALSGAQQSAIAAAFEAAGWSVRGTGRTARGPTLAADLETGAGLEEAFAGADLVVFTLPQDHRPGVMQRIARAIASATAAARVPHLIFNAAGRIDETSDATIFAALRDVRDTLRDGPVPVTVLEPTVFMDNLLAPWSLPGILSGTLAYPAAPDTALAWISHRTLADAAVAAADGAQAGRTLRIGGAPLTARDLTATLAAHLGHPIAYAEIPLAGFAAGLNASFGPPAGDRIAELYANLAEKPGFMAQGAETLATLGVEPERFADFVARNRWTADA